PGLGSPRVNQVRTVERANNRNQPESTDLRRKVGRLHCAITANSGLSSVGSTGMVGVTVRFSEARPEQGSVRSRAFAMAAISAESLVGPEGNRARRRSV